MIELKNEQLTIRVAEKGAELQSVKDADGREYMWQAGPEWSRHSPILFPIVCSVNDNTYRVDGKEYHLSRHGFARDAEFTVVSQSPQKVTLALHDSEDTLKVYPYHFNLAISYKLEGQKIQVIWHVENTDCREIHFQIGGHPAFNVPGGKLEGRIKLDNEAPMTTLKRETSTITAGSICGKKILPHEPHFLALNVSSSERGFPHTGQWGISSLGICIFTQLPFSSF